MRPRSRARPDLAQAPNAAEVEAALGRAWIEDRTAVLAVVARRLADLGRAEDAVQDAFAAAATTWPTRGVPDRPGAWLTTTAWRAALDRERRDRFPLLRNPEDAVHDFPDAPTATFMALDHDTDDLSDSARHDAVLSLILTCCHPALALEAQVALTLRHVVGLPDHAIADRLLVQPATLTKRLVRARAKIKHTAISFDLPDRTQIEERLHGVRLVVYLTFTEGYVAATGAKGRPPPVCEEAIWLARQVHELSPDEETTGLLALLLLHHSRASARWDADHSMLGFDEQDHSLWDTGLIEEATELLGTTGAAEPGPYQVQAAIALLHTRATRGHQPDWSLLTDLYASLYRMTPSPSVAAGYAVALNRTRRSQRALALLEPLLNDPRLVRHTGLHVAHAEALTLSGHKDAAAAWQHAADTATDPARRGAVLRRATRAGQLDSEPMP